MNNFPSRLLIIFFALILSIYLFGFRIDAACEVPDSKDINVLKKAQEDCQKEIDSRLSAHNKNKEDLASLEKNLATTKKLIQAMQAQISVLEKEIFEGEVKLEYQQELLAAKVRSFYKRSRQHSIFFLMLASPSANNLFRELTYRQTVADQDKEQILEISRQLRQLTENREKLEQNKNWLTKTKNRLDQDTASLKKEIEKVEAYFTQVSSKIAELTRKQQELLAEKAGTFQTTVGEVPLADDPNSRPDYNPGFSPAFAAFSFGAPHRKGMSQYGAFGRAKGGQSAEQILKAYYGDVRVERRDLPADISTAVGVLNFEGNYLKGIAEIPSSWADEGGYEALKAQAIAARSYAIKAGKPICITEACQVYRSSKAANPPDAWRRAVEDTRGMVVVSNQSSDVVSTWYASTAGGYLYCYTSSGHTTPGIWDTGCGSQSCWTGEAWEKKAGSPWFYKGWYKTRDGKTCGRSHPWLTGEEMADILNAIAVYRAGGEAASHILPVDYSSCFGKSGDAWSLSQMRQEAAGKGGGFSSVASIDVSYATDGKTAKLNLSTDKGNFEVSGEEFYTVFNLRAPGKISLKSKLFNIEKK